MKRWMALTLAAVLLLAIAVPGPALARAPVWHVPGDFATIQEAIDSPDVAAGDTIRLGAGSYAGALVTKAVSIEGRRNTVINSGPVHSSGLVQGFRLLAGGDGTRFSRLNFEVDLAIMNGAAIDDVAVENCVFKNVIQAVSNWGGSGWKITHNEITDLRCRNGGGIGILIGDRFGGVVEDNIVSYNKISGTLYVDPVDKGGYNGSGIVLYADFRWGMAGAAEIKNNRVFSNKVRLVSDTPEVVDVVAFEMTDSRDDPAATPYPVIFDNTVSYNDFRGTAIQIDLTPDDLGDYNRIWRNFGENCGHGKHPGFSRHEGHGKFH